MINKAIDIIKLIHESNMSLEEIILKYECSVSDLSEDAILDKMSRILQIMLKSTQNMQDKETFIIGHDSLKVKQYAKVDNSYLGPDILTAISHALNVMETNCSMGRIVASPTAGSCGIIPSALMLSVSKHNISNSHAVNGLLVSGMIGTIIAQNATLSGAKGGCQAEIGSASAMASGMLTYFKGGTIDQIFNASALALKTILGLVCDPIAGLVEAPCAKRNAMGINNALLCADLSLAGVISVIPFDEVVNAMYDVGNSMPNTLKETSEGGLAITPTAITISKMLRKHAFDSQYEL